MDDAFGKASVEQSQGYTPLPSSEPPAPKPETFEGDDGLRKAARTISDDDAPVVERSYEWKNGPKEGQPIEPEDKRSVTVERAADDLKAAHQEELTASIEDGVKRLAEAVDAARGAFAAEAGIAPAKPEPEIPPAQSEAPPDRGASNGLSPKVAQALQDPEIRAAIEAPLAQADAMQRQFVQGIDQATQIAAAGLLTNFSELSGLNYNEIPTAIAILAKTNPTRHAEIMGHVQQVQRLYSASQTQRAELDRIEQTKLNGLMAESARQFEDSIKGENPQTVKQIKDSMVSTMRDVYGIKPEDLKIALKNPVLHAPAFQRIVFDAMRYQMAAKGAQTPAPSVIPPVQRPGTAPLRSDGGNIEELSEKFKAAKGTKQLQLAAQLTAAQRAARR